MKLHRLVTLAPIAALALLFAAVSGNAQSTDSPFPPHKVAGNLYYVGSNMLAAYLITSDQGHVLINACYKETVPMIRTSVEKLGFRFQDIKILLNSHAHNDHCAGSAEVRRLTGCRVMVMKGDAELIQAGGKGDFHYDEPRYHYEACPVDRVLSDGDHVRLGGNDLVAHSTPGHTRGCTTWTMQAQDGGKTLNVVIIGSPNVNPGYRLVNNAAYPEITKDYQKCFRVLKSLPVDLFLGAHGAYYDLPAKHARLLQKPEQNPFVDPEGYRRYVAEREAAFLAEWKRQREAGK